MMTGKSVKDIDRYQAVLTSLLALEDNKYCADCESKGPRWASWNLGIFICIRCAGIHRNLGVHISRVKSVNLDQWTQEQVQCVQEMGNGKAKRLYEAFLPEFFQRPETDQCTESFIRDKYDRKKYMDKVIDIQRLRKEKSCDNIPKEPVVFEKMKLKREISPRMQPQTVTDLLVLDAPILSPPVSNGGGSRPVERGSPAHVNPALAHSALDLFSSLPASSSVSSIKTTPVSNSMPRSRVAASVPENLSLFLDPAPKPDESTVKKLSKDSILSLYASTPSVHASRYASTPSVHASSMAAQGLYMNQMGYPTHPYGSYHSLAQAGGMGGTMTASQIAMMGQQQSGMMGVQQNRMMGLQPNGMMGLQQNRMMGLQQNGMMGLQQNGMMGVQQGSMVGQQNGVMGQQGSMVGQQNGMMVAQGVMAQPSGVTASPYMPGMPQGMMGQQQNVMMGQQQVYGQQAQQLQWNITQVTQHMAGVNLYGTNGVMGYSGQHMGGQATPSSTHVATHVWK